ncbi:Putative nuclease HARBI1 [Eumeta japonica]|uniref:Nuclease HARBI1 n=1 Tax=Eumeta variegata TaxID=151549 RepID=A0A4C1VGU1_EUMVA|nr:Putative nuclease HARBI1 [Eumeta japonica]
MPMTAFPSPSWTGAPALRPRALVEETALPRLDAFEIYSKKWENLTLAWISRIDSAIDCTFIKIVGTLDATIIEVFGQNPISMRKRLDHLKKFLDIVARWAGSIHDSRIFRMSAVYQKYNQGILSGRLVGDNGYPSLPFLLTPIEPPPLDPPSERYNGAHIKTRNVVERTFGVWKKRFPCLSKGLGNKLSTVSNIIVATAVLHNLSFILKDVLEWENNEQLNYENPQPESETNLNDNPVSADTLSGFRSIAFDYVIIFA